MNKLQLYINKSLRGYKNLVNFNPSEDVSGYVTDVRDALQQVVYDPAEKNIFYMLRYCPDGVFVVILRTIPDKPLDHLSAWVYVPNGLKISAGELENVLHAVTRKVSGPGVSESDIADLRRLFAEEYRLDREAPAMVAMSGDEYAFSYYATSGRDLCDFLGDKIFQPRYVGYKGVILLDAGLGVSGRCADVTADSLDDVAVILPPEDSQNGFMPYIYGVPFNRPFLAAVGRDAVISWQRQGFEPQQQLVTVTPDGCRPDSIETGEAIKIITPASFLITSQDTKETLSDCVIKVNGREIHDAVTFTQSELAQAQVWVSCDGFFPYSARVDLASTTQALVQMQERRKVYMFEMPLKSTDLGGPVKFEIRTKRELKDSPVDGYQVLDNLQEGPNRTNYLGYIYGAEHISIWQKVLYAVIGLAAGVLLMFMLGRCSEPGDGAPARQQQSESGLPADSAKDSAAPTAVVPVSALPESAAAQVQAAEAVSVGAADDEAIAYLDSSKQWKREEMEKYPLLRGLWDDMNTYKLTEIRDHWAKKLSKSKNFSKVADAAKKGINKRTNLSRHKSHTPTFNPSGDNTIGYVGWTYYVDP